MAKKKKSPLPELPDLPVDPLEALETFDSVVTGFQRAVDAVDHKLSDIERTAGEVDKRFRLPSLPTRPETRKPKPHEHLSYEGQSELDYCLECIVNKHGPTGKTLMGEAVQRARAASPSDPGVIEKVRGVVDELVGIEDDSDTVKNEKVEALNDLARTLRKHIYATKADIGGASLKELKEIKDMMDKLVDAAYQVRVSEECIGCTVEELCRGNVECVEFVEKAAKNVKDPEEFRKIIRQAREKYGRG